MERKRKLPPRAAARKDDTAVAKKRKVTALSPSPTSAVPESPPREPTPSPPPQPPSPLPKSIEVGKPLPTVEEPQPINLSSTEYQSLAESGVLSESITRSRQNWISEGLFEKFWTKPHKRKGVLQEDPNNPPKDSMTKVGAVVITLEPHIVEATMFTVKTSKLPSHLLQKFHPKQQPPQPTSQQGPSSQPEAISHAQTSSQPPKEQSLSLSRTNEQTSAQAQPKAPPQPPLARPVIQYGPPSGSMPPPSVSHATTATPDAIHRVPASAPSSAGTPPTSSPATAASIVMAAPGPSETNSSNAPHMTSPAPAHSTKAPLSTNSSAAVQPPAKTQASPRPGPVVKPQASPAPTTKPPRISPEASQSKTAPSASAASGVVPNSTQQAVPPPPVSTPRPAGRPPSNLPPPPKQGVAPSPIGNQASNAVPRSAGAASSQSHAPSVTKTHTPWTPAAAAVKPAANDPVIALLAQKASKDPGLRDLMKRVAVGEAKDGELAKFQKIIDQLNAEYRQRGGQQGPSAERLLVDKRTVKYFADEVRTILDIVLASNPNQKSSELRPPPGSDPLVVLLVKTALEDQRTRDMIHRIAEGKPGFTDATDLKEILDRLHRDAKIIPKGTPTPAHAVQSRQPAATVSTKTTAQQNTQQVNAQALKSKGPPPASRPDISAVVFDFGMGDRFLFPKFSILEFLPTQSGQQVVASFLIVRKGSTSEYGADPKLDYYQPVTIRLQTSGGRQLENLARVVAPQDEVRRYMDSIMDNMTRAEYILLAMKLPRADFDPEEVESIVEGSKTSSSTPKSESEMEQTPTPKPGVLWARGSGAKDAEPVLSPKLQDPEQEAQSKYERLIRAVAEKEEANL